MDEKRFRQKFFKRLIERGIDREFAHQTTHAFPLDDIDLSEDDPADVADEELSYWGD